MKLIRQLLKNLTNLKFGLNLNIFSKDAKCIKKIFVKINIISKNIKLRRMVHMNPLLKILYLIFSLLHI